MSIQSEAALEAGLIATLRQMDYEYVQIDEEDNLQANFKQQLEIHNRKRLAEHGRTEFTDEEFEKILIYLEGGARFEKAKKLRDLYPLDTADGKRIWVEFLNRQQWCQNEFQVSNQITVEGRKKCRYDVTILINGLPLVQIELKRRGVELKQAYNQIQRYHKTSFHGLFDYIQLFVISNGVNTRYFANNPNSGYKFTFNWTDAANVPFNELDKFAVFFFEKCTLGKIIGKYIVLHEGDKCLMVLRPYQFYAVEKILDKVTNSNDNGYIWHTTGAGKTLTSFKAAQLVSELDDVDKVMFVVDRHDLDTQTQSEYEAFEPGAVDGTDNTDELVKRLHSNSKIIITTIQKLNAAVSKTWYSNKIEAIRHSRIVMIFDECHRSHFGESHKRIMKFFDNAQVFGFTGTPIFTENAVDGHTTKEIFGNCLHQYLIKDAIADENVLGFLVEYYHGSEEVEKGNANRMEEIAKFILNNFNKSTFDGEFDALFAVQSVPMLIRYYKIFKSLNPKIRIGAVFTYAANSSQDDEQTGMNTGRYVSESTGEADELQAIMNDYNEMFGTAFTTENFRAYYDDINLRMKKKKADMKPLDLCLVVGMFLTGFDSKKLNTLYVDKNLEYHGLLQAFSRTNRVLNEKKRFGKIVCFRDLKSNVDTAIRLFSNSNNPEEIVRPPFEDVKKEYQQLATDFLQKYPEPSSIDLLQSEKDKKDFVLAFRDIIRKHAEIQIYEDYNDDADDLGLFLGNLQVPVHELVAVGREATVPFALAGLLPAALHRLDKDILALDLGDSGENGNHQRAAVLGGVDAVLHADEVDAEVLHPLQGGQHVRGVAAEAGELEHQHEGDAVLAGFDVPQHAKKLRAALDVLAGFALVAVFPGDEHVLELRVLAQLVLLRVQAVAVHLHGGGDAGIDVAFHSLHGFSSCGLAFAASACSSSSRRNLS